MMTGALAFAFIAGTITTVNPCGLALLPAYFARRLGTDAASTSPKIVTVVRALKVGSITTIGVLLVFGVAGGAVSLGGRWLTTVLPWAGLAIGIVLAAIGLSVMAGKHISVRLPMPKIIGETTGMNTGADLSYGIGYGIVSLSCALPIFLTVTSMTLSGNAISSVFNFVAYALGVGTILTGLSVAAALARNGLASLLKRFLPYVNRASGALLFLAGIYVTLLWGAAIFEVDVPGSDILVTGERLSSTLKSWFAGQAGKILALGVLVLLITMSVWSLFNQRTGKEHKRRK